MNRIGTSLQRGETIPDHDKLCMLNDHGRELCRYALMKEADTGHLATGVSEEEYFDLNNGSPWNRD